MPPAARVGDMHVCPMVTPGVPPIPHVGGPILPPGGITVMIGMMPAARMGDMCVCVGPPDTIAMGSPTVLIGNMMAARLGDPTVHGGSIVLGCPTVMIGEAGGGGSGPGAGGGAGGAASMAAGMSQSKADSDSGNASKYSSSGGVAFPEGDAGGGAGGGTPAAPKPVSPCAGKGMQTPDNEKEFAKGVKDLQGKWAKLTPAEREAELGKLANAEASKSGVPALGINTANKLAGTPVKGQLDFKSWNLDINKDLTNSDTLTDAQTKDLGNTVYHETRHGEQWYLIARKMAADGKTPEQIHDATKIPLDTCKAAKKNPLGKDDPMAACAQAMYDSVYGTGKDHRNGVLRGRPAARKAVADAKDVLAMVKADPESTPEETKAAEDALKAAQKANAESYQAYRDLPEEADAWATGDAVGNLL